MIQKTFEQELSELLNKYNQDGKCRTPDYILAKIIVNFLDSFAIAVVKRDSWCGLKYSNIFQTNIEEMNVNETK